MDDPMGKVFLTATNKHVSLEGEALVLKTFGPEFIMGRNLLKLFGELKIFLSDPPIVEISAIHMEASSGIEAVRKVTAMVWVTKLLQNSGLSVGHALINCSKTDTVVHVMNVDHADHLIVEGTSNGLMVRIDQTSNLSLEDGEGRNAAREVSGRSGKP
ncbi:hypothetical protein OUZ56_005979 [Daphnia magna]|uniref:Uncharacterized protein n=1 Tax=Daphnia magna TaxID=35525 RepID=A0ABQ9YU93_9CRUS|nr:hypothetical protein OUZ56_005979 [Daphnia magna]